MFQIMNFWKKILIRPRNMRCSCKNCLLLHTYTSLSYKYALEICVAQHFFKKKQFFRKNQCFILNLDLSFGVEYIEQRCSEIIVP